MTVKKQYPAINYTSRDFNSIKNDLIEYAKRYYPNTFQDFNEAGFGSLMLDTVSYVGDILSFYLDYSANESFIDTAIEYDNVLRLGRQVGYQFKGSPSSFGMASFYAIIPAATTGLGPDTAYLGYVRRGTELQSTNGIGFILNEDVSLADPSNEVVVAKVNSSTGLPTHYAVRATGQVISGQLSQEVIALGSFEEFRKIQLAGENISEIISITDSEGNEYYRVDYLSQDVVYAPIKNYDSNRAKSPSVLKPVIVPRRYVVEQLEDTTMIQFGGAKENATNTDTITDPSKTIVNFHGREFISSLSFDPSNLLGTPTLGVAPANTNITVVYRTNVYGNVNAPVNSLSNITNPIIDFDNIMDLSTTKISEIVNSLEVNNEKPINGDVTLPSIDELKIRINDSFSSQRRAVTEQDYRSLIYAMPPEFGGIKRANIIRDPDSFKRNLNIYVIAESSEGYLEAANTTIKQNVKTWLNQGRMINDTIDIIDAKIVNFGIDFVIVGDLETNKFVILNRAIEALNSFYENKLEIGEPFFITDIYNELNQVDGVVDTVSVKITSKTGINYAETRFNIDKATSPDGRFISVPDNVVMELKFPATDIRGDVK